jgi:hypothetical protein
MSTTIIRLHFQVNIPAPNDVLIGAGPPCCTCVMMLAAPPAAAMTYVNPSRGLEPSLYGGGGSPSSKSFSDRPSLVSRGSAAFVSATTVEGAPTDCVSSNGGAGAYASRVSAALAVATSERYGSADDGCGK